MKSGENLPAVLLILILIISIMSPLGSNIPVESSANDLLNHISGVIEAKNALAEGQFPIRIAPNALDGERYPIFQFYGNFPYTLGAIFYIITDEPYFAYKLVIMLSLFLGAYYLYKFGLLTTQNKYAATIASTVYLTAPYLLTDIHGRFAFPEIVSFGILPCVFYYLFKGFYSKNVIDYLFLSFFLALLFLTHNIFSLYTMVFLFIIVICLFLINRESYYSIFGMISSSILAFLISAWYLIPQLILSNNLVIKILQNNPFDSNYLTTIWVLFAPSKILPLPINYFEEVGNTNLGFQIGAPVLTFIVCGIIILTSKKYSKSNTVLKRNNQINLTLLKILVFCSFVAFLLILSPVNFWSYLPSQLLYVQVTCRILVYLVIFGAMIAPIVLIKIFEEFKLEHAAIILLICLSFTSTYLPNHIGEPENTITDLVSSPDMGGGGATTIYQMSKLSLSSNGFPYGDKTTLINGYSGGWLLNTANIYINESQYNNPIIIEMKGNVPEQTGNLILTFFLNGEYLNQTNLQRGSFMINIPINNISKYNNSVLNSQNNKLNIEIESNKYFIPSEIDPRSTDNRKLALLLDSFKIFPQMLSSDEYISARDPRIQKISSNKLVINNSNSLIVQLPVLYYPDMIEIKINGKSVTCMNIGNKVGVMVPPGKNEITYEFTGLKWTNYLSLTSLFIFVIICLYQLRKYFLEISKNDN
ncbi:hypothetical protein L1994_11705 [Methanomicrobium antiquum]|uniref:Membrane protein 6-pyruvoyl-tetrahydropterin synthase-related domain-containing protein n=1 Tax=Methanomicrobium antiquum TaxID=487686 RepID=A0AAF0FLM2_9EURY|nr:6-pyruvoyl-tetrahydropterin synthase-related protein [Methanomicrobium antiquum]WFN36783.1 hypothetical protein L1994_11705 [Methanomicrobium antiquum]